MASYDPHLLRPGAAEGLGQRTLPKQAGSGILQTLIMVPVLALVAMLGFAFGKLALAQITTAGAAHAAVRAATLERTLGAAEAAGQAAAEIGTAAYCSSVSIDIGGDLTPGGVITATLTCTVTGTGVAVLNGRTITAEASSPVDRWRGDVA
ncbi:pilus assembly protein [Glycomyces sp. NPDC047369]